MLPKHHFRAILKQPAENLLKESVSGLMMSPSLSCYPSNVVKEVFARSFIVEFTQNAVLCEEGEEAQAVYFILEGEFSLWSHSILNRNKSQQKNSPPFCANSSKFRNRKAIKTSVLGENELFGALAVIDSSTHSHSLVCDSLAGCNAVLVIPRDVFEAKIVANEDLVSVVRKKAIVVKERRENMLKNVENQINLFRHYRYEVLDTDEEDVQDSLYKNLLKAK